MKTKYTITHEEIRSTLAQLLADQTGFPVQPNDLEFDTDENECTTATLLIED